MSRQVALAVWLVAQAPLSAAVITVSTASGCTLVNAITAANTDTATGSCTKGDGTDRIVLDQDVTLSAVNNTTDLANGLPSVTSTLTIQGDDHTVSRSMDGGTPDFRIFHIGAGGDLTLLNTTVSNGAVTVPLPPTIGGGGGIFNKGRLTLVHGTVSGNTVKPTSASNTRGGGIFNEAGAVALHHSRIKDNTVEAGFSDIVSGGGIYSSGGAVALTQSTVSMNTLDPGFSVVGAGIALRDGASLHANGSTISFNFAIGNSATLGGGLSVSNGSTATLINTTVSGNEANAVASGEAKGGGIWNDGTLDLVHTTFSTNTVSSTGSQAGGSLFNDAGTVNITASLFDNTSPGHCSGAVNILGTANRADVATCGAMVADLLIHVDLTLADNGGPVETHAISDASSARDIAGSCGLLIDGREALRSDEDCDSGAFEYGADDPFELSGDPDGDDECFGHHLSLGKAERHLHRQDAVDWIWFEAKEEATYEIRTSNLLGGTDTILDLFEDCGPSPIKTDDNAGESLITYGPLEANAPLDVRITEKFASSAPQFGYDVRVTCTAGCPACTLPGGDSYDLSYETIFSYRRIEACTKVLSTGVTTVKAGAKAILRAGSRVEFENGFNVEENGAFSVEIDPNLVPVP